MSSSTSTTISSASMSAAVSQATTTSASRPNFIFIVADDIGTADLGYAGARADENLPGGVTPNLDRMAKNGLYFTHGYSNSPVCSPTRFALITGRYQYRFHASNQEPISSAMRGNNVMGLPPSHPTLPSLLRDAGYATALVGKWHLGFAPHFGPLKSGYDTFFGAMAGGVDYFSHQAWGGVHDLWDGDEACFTHGYLTDLFSQRAEQFVRDQAKSNKPFFLSLHYTAPHWPWETRDDEQESKRIGSAISHNDGGSIQIYRKMIHHMDEGIGNVVKALQECGIDENTLIIFTSDNGGERFSDSWPFVGGKYDLTEGGIRVPLIAQWPARCRGGLRTDTPAISMDWCATILEAAGVRPRADYPLDGVSLLPLFADSNWNPNRRLYWRMFHRSQRAVLDGSWKYLRVDNNDYLFNIDVDARERANQALRQPDRIAEMRSDWERWASAMPGIPADASASFVFTEKNMPRSTF